MKFLALTVLLAMAGFGHTWDANSFSNYTQTGGCQDERTCRYGYTVEQEYFGQEGQQFFTISSIVLLTCHSSGEFNELPATQYCMTLTGTTLRGSMFNETTSEDRKYHRKVIKNLLSGWFCFIQTENGKVVAVQHASNETNDAINFKKAIAAAFQANFKGTDLEEETDTQSRHNAHYSYEPTSNGSLVMHRRVDNNDIIESTSQAPKEDLKFTQMEDIEYRNGSLIHSRGHTDIKYKKRLGKVNNINKNRDQPSFSDIFSAHGSYNLDLQYCYSVPQHQKIKQKRSLQIDDNMLEENLGANIDEVEEERTELSLIRKDISSVTDALNNLFEQPENRQLIVDLRRLLELENKHGTPPHFTPAVEEVVHYLKNILSLEGPRVQSMRKIMYTLLSAEGSRFAQMTLFEVLQTVSSVQEKDMIVSMISTLENAHIDLLYALKQELLVGEQDGDVLLLTIGILASKAQPEVANEIVTFLRSLEENAVPEGSSGSFDLIDVILAMGNTGSEDVASTILDYVNDPIEEVQLAAIRALLKFIHLEQVRNALMELLESRPSEDIVTVTVHTLVKGYRHSMDEGLETSLADHPVLATMVSAALDFNNTNLLALVENFLLEVGGEQALNLIAELHTRVRRASTTDWDTNDSRYNLVASQSSRTSDVINHPYHTAYLWQDDFGDDDAELKAAAGIFLGRSSNYENMKSFAKLYAEGRILDQSPRSLIDAEILLQKTGSTIRGRTYIRIGSNVRTNYDRTTQCYNYDSDLFQGQFRLFRFKWRLHIYVASVGVDINVNLQADIDFHGKLCGSGSIAEARGSATGIANLDGTAVLNADGSVHATLLSVARAGITAEASLNIRPEARSKALICAGLSSGINYHACTDAHYSHSAMRLRLFAWYQLRRVRLRTCGGWIKYPCIRVTWGSRHSVLSKTWSFGRQGRRVLLHPRCTGSSSPTCTATLG